MYSVKNINKNADEFLKKAIDDIKKSTEILELLDVSLVGAGRRQGVNYTPEEQKLRNFLAKKFKSWHLLNAEGLAEIPGDTLKGLYSGDNLRRIFNNNFEIDKKGRERIKKNIRPREGVKDSDEENIEIDDYFEEERKIEKELKAKEEQIKKFKKMLNENLKDAVDLRKELEKIREEKERGAMLDEEIYQRALKEKKDIEEIKKKLTKKAIELKKQKAIELKEKEEQIKKFKKMLNENLKDAIDLRKELEEIREEKERGVMLDEEIYQVALKEKIPSIKQDDDDFDLPGDLFYDIPDDLPPSQIQPTPSQIQPTPSQIQPVQTQKKKDIDIRYYIEKTLKVKNNIKNLLQKFKKNLNFYNYFNRNDVDDMIDDMKKLNNRINLLIDKFDKLTPKVENADKIIDILNDIKNNVNQIYNIILGGGNAKIGGVKLYNTYIIDSYKYR